MSMISHMDITRYARELRLAPSLDNLVRLTAARMEDWSTEQIDRWLREHDAQAETDRTLIMEWLTPIQFAVFCRLLENAYMDGFQHGRTDRGGVRSNQESAAAV